MPHSVLSRLLAWFSETLPSSKTAELNEDSELLDSRLLDSVQIIDLVSYIEKEFNVAVDVAEVIPENFSNLRSIISMIERLSGSDSST